MSFERVPLLLRKVGLLLAAAAPMGCGDPPPQPVGAESLDWKLERLDALGDLPVTLLGQPRVVETEAGTAIEFDGVDDALLLDLHPLEGAAELTVEALFRADPGGADEQRFLHVQETGTKDRLLLETRWVPGGQWFLDTYVKTGGTGYTLYAKRHLHDAGRWYHVALVVDGETMRHFVDGREELSRPIDFRPQGRGRTSIGVRINRVSWFKGALARVRFSPRALAPEEFFGP